MASVSIILTVEPEDLDSEIPAEMDSWSFEIPAKLAEDCDLQEILWEVLKQHWRSK